MTHQQAILFALFAVVLALLLWGRIRHDLVAASGLFAAVLLGLVPADMAFSGFANPAVAIIALVLIASRALHNSGALGLATQALAKRERPLAWHIALIGMAGAALSSVINNVAALAVLMPLDIQAARKAGRAPGLSLMPLSFATILGGLVTLIGTPPNIVAAGIRRDMLGAPYKMFDFAPVGLTVAVAGVAFVALLGWRFLARPARGAAPPREEEFMAELAVPEKSTAVGRTLAELETEAERADVMLLGIVHDGKRSRARFVPVDPGDALVVEGPTDRIVSFIGALGLQRAETEGKKGTTKSVLAGFAGGSDSDHVIVEAVVRTDGRIVGRSVSSFRLRSRFGVTLLGISHRGSMLREKLGGRRIESGDVLLLSGPRDTIGHVLDWLGALSVNQVAVAPAASWRIAVAVGLLAAAIVVASLGLLPFEIAVAIAVVGYAATGLVPAQEFYREIDWPVVVMLACLLPLGEAFDRLGATDLVARMLSQSATGLPPVATLALLMVGTMALSDVLNNVATIVIAGPLAVAIAAQVHANPDTFLMGVTVAASCAFMTPIGHKNNLLILGPGQYRFSDYWRLGLPLELVVLAVGIPALLVFWPIAAPA